MLDYELACLRNRLVTAQLEQFSPRSCSKYFQNIQLNVPFEVQINLNQLGYQMHLSKPMSKISASRRTKFRDYNAYLARITSDTHLKFDISDMKNESKQQASEIIAEGISRCLLIKLLTLRENSINKIDGNKKRPDFKARTYGGDLIICESKGSFAIVPRSEIIHAITQKSHHRGHLRIAAINNIGALSRLIDPPIDSEKSDRFSTLISKANHYIQVFKLAGQPELTTYFRLMKKRFKNRNMTNFPEFSEKKYLWFKLKYERQRITIEDNIFIGKVEFIGNNKFGFIGFDEKLLAVDTFESFEDYRDTYSKEDEQSTTFISRDGVCFIEANITKLGSLFPDIQSQELKNYQESTWLADIDTMTEAEFSNYLAYIFRESKLDFQKEPRVGKRRPDYIVCFKGKIYYLELKLFDSSEQLTYQNKRKVVTSTKNMWKEKENWGREIKLLPGIALTQQILVTNKDSRLATNTKGIIIFDRNELKKLLRNKNYFNEFLSKLDQN